ncbi:MAG: helix-turn-helix transcriptional regulator [Armatimonadota bacterium]|nr:MAG: helix-turn-helix transcriptional regulator [Armatimonadota bacterium]
MLLAIAGRGEVHGYQIAQEAEGMAVTHAGLDSGVIYRTLRRLEAAGRVVSRWDTSRPGPARRVYVLTESGMQHLREWAQVLEAVTASLQALTHNCQKAAQSRRSAATRPALPVGVSTSRNRMGAG